jgi:hypothetical protein
MTHSPLTRDVSAVLSDIKIKICTTNINDNSNEASLDITMDNRDDVNSVDIHDETVTGSINNPNPNPNPDPDSNATIEPVDSVSYREVNLDITHIVLHELGIYIYLYLSNKLSIYLIISLSICLSPFFYLSRSRKVIKKFH